MPKITFVSPNGDETELNLNSGSVLMHEAVDNDVEEITAECGGSLACATCHVFIDDAFLERTGEVGESEDDMLEQTAVERRPNSRLSCQVTITDDMDGMKVYLPEEQ